MSEGYKPPFIITEKIVNLGKWIKKKCRVLAKKIVSKFFEVVSTAYNLCGNSCSKFMFC